jgi:hypothetical protein
LEEKLNSKPRIPDRKVPQLIIAWGVCLLATLYMAGCSIGPITIGEPDATPTPPGPTATATPPPRALTGRVEDAFTGKPIEGAEITAGGVLTATAADGLYYFEDVPEGSKMIVSAEGYSSVEIETGTSNEVPVKLRPSLVTGRVTDGSTGKPLEGVLVKLVLPSTPTPETETLPVPDIITATVVPTSTEESIQPGFGKALAAPQPQAAATRTAARRTPTRSTARSTPTRSTPRRTATPTVEDEESEEEAAPTRTPTIAPPTPTSTPKPPPPTGDGFVAVYTDANGAYSFKDVPPGSSLTFKMPGYKLTKVPLTDATEKDIALEVFKAEAAYITANVAASKDLYDDLIEFILDSRINSVVLNVQTDASAWVYDTKNEDAIEAENTDIFLEHMPEIVRDLKEKGIYTIARIVTFQQKTMAENRPEWAIKSSVTGKPWRGGSNGQHKWLDASHPEVQQHLIDMTKEVLALGFDEVQYDYVRFPSDPSPGESMRTMVFSRPLTDTGKALALQQFLKKAHDTIEPTDAFMSIDVFGYTLWPDRDGEPILGVIGQVLEYIQDYTDYISPMIYPSHFSPGEQGCANPAVCAYELIKQSGIYAQKRFEGRKVKYRPWLQAFDWGRVDYTSPGTTKVLDQVRACEETDCWGWLWWDPANVYEPRSAFKKKK